MPDNFIYDDKKPSSKARISLVTAWLLLGFLIVMGYKSVLLASLVSVQNEKPIETLEDMLVTDRKILMFATTSTDDVVLRTDPRYGMQQLAKKITWIPNSETNVALTSEKGRQQMQKNLLAR